LVAWTSFANLGAIGGTNERTSFVISAQTGEHFEQVNGLRNAFLSWSPQEDLLLVIDPTDRIMMDATTVPHYLARISLIDMTTQTVITEFELDVNGTPKWADGHPTANSPLFTCVLISSPTRKLIRLSA
jgi:hypothetical protein